MAYAVFSLKINHAGSGGIGKHKECCEADFRSELVLGRRTCTNQAVEEHGKTKAELLSSTVMDKYYIAGSNPACQQPFKRQVQEGRRIV